MQRVGGFRRKTRHKLQKNIRRKGKISLPRYFQEFKEGEKVCLAAEPAVQKGFYYPRYHGKAGIIGKKRGNCYEIEIMDNKMKKTVIVHPIHLKKL